MESLNKSKFMFAELEAENIEVVLSNPKISKVK
jgi:hypothetical protein